MTWLALSLDCLREGADWVRTTLAKTAYAGELEVSEYVPPDGKATTGDNWDYSLRFYLASEPSPLMQVDEIRRSLSSLERVGMVSPLRVTLIPEESAPAPAEPIMHRIGERFVILEPEATYVPKPNDILLKLKPSLAFGSGLHPATILSLQLLERHVAPGMHALDLGCGSGILSLAMATLGASVLALDNDAIAVQATQTAVDQNGLSDRVTVQMGSLGQGSELGHWLGGELPGQVPAIGLSTEFDLIVANILARIHLSLVDDYRRVLRSTHIQGGLLIIAGFTTDYETDLNAAVAAAGFRLIDRAPLDEWVALVYCFSK